MSDVVGECAGAAILKVAKHADIEEWEDDDKPPPVKMPDIHEKDSDEDCGEEIFEADDAFEERRNVHVLSVP